MGVENMMFMVVVVGSVVEAWVTTFHSPLRSRCLLSLFRMHKDVPRTKSEYIPAAMKQLLAASVGSSTS